MSSERNPSERPIMKQKHWQNGKDSHGNNSLVKDSQVKDEK